MTVLPTDAAAVKRGFLYALVGSVAVSALLGIAAIVFDDFGEWAIRSLLSAVTIGVASICGLGCGAYLASARHRALPLTGIALAIAAAAALLLVIWAEIDSSAFWRTTGSLCVFAIAVAHLCLLSMARLDERFKWSLVVAYVIILFVAALITGIIWFAEMNEAPVFRLLAVAAILDAAITIVIPIFHRLSRAH